MQDTVSILKTIHKHIDRRWEEQLAFLKEIGRYPSTLGNEQPLQRYLSNYFTQVLQMDVDRFTPDVKTLSSHPGFSPPEWSYDGREVVTASAGNTGNSGRSLLFQSHIDVVPPGPLSFWDTDPWEPTLKGQQLYGRGMQDMKSGTAAMIFAYRAIIDAGCRPDAPFMLQTVIEEESTGNGALAALERGWKAEAVLIPEPFGMKATIAHSGSIWFRITVNGTNIPAPGEKAVNAIEKSPLIFQALKSYEAMINERSRPKTYANFTHPLEINIGRMNAGDWPSNVPNQAVIEGRAGLFPGQDPSDIKAELKQWVLEQTSEDPWFAAHPPEIYFFGYHAAGDEVSRDISLMRTLDQAHRSVHDAPLGFQAVPVTTDTRFYNLYYDIPATCYGPVGANMHGCNEWVDIDSVKQVTKVYASFLAEWCGLKPAE